MYPATYRMTFSASAGRGTGVITSGNDDDFVVFTLHIASKHSFETVCVQRGSGCGRPRALCASFQSKGIRKRNKENSYNVVLTIG